MKNLLFAISILMSMTAFSQSTEKKAKEESELKTVQVSCGQCQFGLTGSGCDLAVDIDGAKYYVDGAHMDDFGDAHGHGGMCTTIREAKVSGEIIDGRYKASKFVLLPMKKEKK